jgi:hypothetical protein
VHEIRDGSLSQALAGFVLVGRDMTGVGGSSGFELGTLMKASADHMATIGITGGGLVSSVGRPAPLWRVVEDKKSSHRFDLLGVDQSS